MGGAEAKQQSQNCSEHRQLCSINLANRMDNLFLGLQSKINSVITVASVPICWHVNNVIVFINLMEVGTCFVAMSIAIDLRLSEFHFVSMFLVSLVIILEKYSQHEAWH